MYKQIIIIRKDLKLGKGKMVSQGAHASLQAYKLASPRSRRDWESNGGKKVVVFVQSRKELMKLYSRAKRLGLPCSIVKDAGLTQTRPGTETAVAIGPCSDKRVDTLTGKLKLL